MTAIDEYIKRYGICPLEYTEKDIYKTGLGYFIVGWDAHADEAAALRAENEALRNEAQADYGTGLALRAENDEFRIALKVAIVCNAQQKSWGVESPFQKRLDNMVGKFEHGEVSVNREDIAEGYCCHCDTPLADASAAREHGKVCAKHPLRAELDAANKAVEDARKTIGADNEWFAQYPFDNKAFEGNSATGRYHETSAWLTAHPKEQE